MAKHFNTFGKAKVKIYRKKLYKQRFKMSPDELGLVRVRFLFNRPKQIAPIFSTRRSIVSMETPTTFYFPSDVNLFLGSAKRKNEQVLL